MEFCEPMTLTLVALEAYTAEKCDTAKEKDW